MVFAVNNRQEKKLTLLMDTNQASHSEASGYSWQRQPVETSLGQLMLLFRPLAQEITLKQHWGHLDRHQVYQAAFSCTEYFDQLKKAGVTKIKIDAAEYERVVHKTHLDQRVERFLSLLHNLCLDLPVNRPMIYSH